MALNFFKAKKTPPPSENKPVIQTKGNGENEKPKITDPVKALVERDANGDPVLGPNGKWKRGKRVPLVKPEDLRAWLIRKSGARCRDQATGLDVPSGFRIVENEPLEISPMAENHFRKNGQIGYHAGVQFRGTLEVTDRERFIETYQSGIGSAKGFGFGLLLLAPVKL